MKISTSDSPEVMISKDAIYEQLKKIFLHTLFINSAILRKFLLFIVEQTITGHRDWLKEYTIGIRVLDKPTNFKPQDNGIVRIHANRLRRALHRYYTTAGASDPIKISVPKGRYIPVFIENKGQIKTAGLTGNENLADSPNEMVLKKRDAIAVMPFQHFRSNALENSFIDGLGQQLSTALMQLEKYSVVAYCSMRDVWKKTNDVSKAAELVDAKYLITGGIQVQERLARVHIQIIDLYSGSQVLSCMYENEFSSQHIFKMQDEIVQFIISQMARSRKLAIKNKTTCRSFEAVA